MADSPVTINKPGTMAQAAVAATAPEGMLIAPIWKRVVALGLDGFLISIILWFSHRECYSAMSSQLVY